jgi:hypothetical protein
LAGAAAIAVAAVAGIAALLFNMRWIQYNRGEGGIGDSLFYVLCWDFKLVYINIQIFIQQHLNMDSNKLNYFSCPTSSYFKSSPRQFTSLFALDCWMTCLWLTRRLFLRFLAYGSLGLSQQTSTGTFERLISNGAYSSNLWPPPILFTRWIRYSLFIRPCHIWSISFHKVPRDSIQW